MALPTAYEASKMTGLLGGLGKNRHRFHMAKENAKAGAKPPIKAKKPPTLKEEPAKAPPRAPGKLAPQQFAAMKKMQGKRR